MEPKSISQILKNKDFIKNTQTSNCENPECGAELSPDEGKEIFSEKLRVTKTLCSKCYKKTEAANVAIMEKRKKQKAESLLTQANFKARHRDIDFDSATKGSILKALISDQFDRNIYLHGEVGTGKTFLAVAYFKKIIRSTANPGLMINAVELLNEIRSSFSPKSVIQTEEVIEKYCQVDYLLIDDLGAEKGGEWVNETFYLILNRRYESMNPIIVTSNLRPENIAEKLGDRIASRLLGHEAVVIELKGADKRLKTRPNPNRE